MDSRRILLFLVELRILEAAGKPLQLIQQKRSGQARLLNEKDRCASTPFTSGTAADRWHAAAPEFSPDCGRVHGAASSRSSIISANRTPTTPAGPSGFLRDRISAVPELDTLHGREESPLVRKRLESFANEDAVALLSGLVLER